MPPTPDQQTTLQKTISIYDRARQLSYLVFLRQGQWDQWCLEKHIDPESLSLHLPVIQRKIHRHFLLPMHKVQRVMHLRSAHFQCLHHYLKHKWGLFTRETNTLLFLEHASSFDLVHETRNMHQALIQLSWLYLNVVMNQNHFWIPLLNGYRCLKRI